MKRDSNRPQVKTRESVPAMKQNDRGVVIGCPFCTPTHPLVPGKMSPCGTVLKLTAVQNVIPSRIARINNLMCVKCHKVGGGEMVQWQGGYLHLEDCDPNTRLLIEPPPFSVYARLIYGLPEKLRPLFAGKRGTPQPVREVLADGVETGKVLGYVFVKVKNGQTSPVGA